MRYRVGRFLQLLGLCIVPTGLAGNVLTENKPPFTEGTILVIAAIGGVVFAVGWLMQGKRT
jgi:hypothetical protein